MPDHDESDTQRAVTRFNELGTETVRQLLARDGFPQGWRLIAMRPAREPKYHHYTTTIVTGPGR
jgi:hypothetical protein